MEITKNIFIFGVKRNKSIIGKRYMEYFFFHTHRKYMYSFLYPNTTKITLLTPEKEDDNGIMMVDCENNFDSHQMEIICNEKMKAVEDVLQNHKIPLKQRLDTYLCFVFVKEMFEKKNQEPSNTYVILTIQKINFYVKIFPDGTIKYCNCK